MHYCARVGCMCLSLSVYDRQQATSAADEVTGDTCVNLEMPLGCQKVRRKEGRLRNSAIWGFSLLCTKEVSMQIRLHIYTLLYTVNLA